MREILGTKANLKEVSLYEDKIKRIDNNTSFYQCVVSRYAVPTSKQ